jgi:hypothetical protein
VLENSEGVKLLQVVKLNKGEKENPMKGGGKQAYSTIQGENSWKFGEM